MLSLLPPNDLPTVELFAGADKVVHFGMYFIFALLGCWTSLTESPRFHFVFILPAAIGWGFVMEILQLSMQIGRSFSWFDILANSAGAMAGILVYRIIARKFTGK